jgi:hypothetical protein
MIKKTAMLSLVAFLLIGCAAIERGGASVSAGKIENPSLGFFGFSYEIPQGFELYDPSAKDEEACTDLQQMAIRIYDTNNSYHPSGNETFYESFLMFSENAAFLLVTVEYDRLSESGGPWEDTAEMGMQRQLLPAYNISNSHRISLGNSRMEALLSSGRAYEKKGWYYTQPKNESLAFSYELCRISGVNRDGYILMGFSLPENKQGLSLQMQEMIDGFRF